MKNIVKKLESTIKVNFNNKELLVQSITHKSYDEKCYKLWLFVNFLKDNLTINKYNIPWN